VKILLNQAEARVLGSLIEKDITTPDYYPLSLNSLISACNQKSNREPVMTLDEETVRLALRNLQEKKLAGPVSGADSRVTKYEHRLQEVFNFDRRETAIVCVLFLRGPQTPGELRGRTERMHRFDDLSEVQSALQSLMQRDPPIAKVLPRQPGTKEARYMHLFCGDVEPLEPAASLGASAGSELELERIERLENEVAGLRREIADLKQQFEELQMELKTLRDAP
jgi:hypothetical protein